MSDVAGIDVGLTLLDRTSGVFRTGTSGDVLDHTYADRLSRLAALGGDCMYSVMAIDAPVLPPHQLNYEVRACEKVFVWGEFQKRCKPGESHVPGTGQALRRAGVETAHSFETSVATTDVGRVFPRVFGQRNIVEAFPNGFLGVCLRESVFQSCPQRAEKFDWLYEQWLSNRTLEQVTPVLDWPRDAFWRAVATTRQHDERAALVCAMTALCVLRGRYVAVGEGETGFFFLPPWGVWQPWARSALATNRRDVRLPRSVDVWIDGTRYSSRDRLPD